MNIETYWYGILQNAVFNLKYLFVYEMQLLKINEHAWSLLQKCVCNISKFYLN